MMEFILVKLQTCRYNAQAVALFVVFLVLTKLWPYSIQPAILPKTELTLNLIQEELKILMYAQENMLRGISFL